MRIRAVPYEVPYRRPIQTAHGELLTRKGYWVLAEDDSGHVGLGEVAPLPAWGTETFEAAGAALSALSFDLASVETQDPQAWLGAAGLSRESTPATAAGVELACLDLLARRRGLSLASLLAQKPSGTGVPLERVPLNALLTSREPDELVAEARRRLAEGYKTLKLKVGVGAIARDVSRVRALREAVGPDVGLRADANAAWDRDDAVKAIRQLRPFDLQYLEQPVASANDLAFLRDRACIPIAADESAQDPVAVRRLLAEHAVDWLILKPMALGGLVYTAQLAREAQRAGIGLTLTSVLDRGIGTAGALHLAAALGVETACGLSNTHMAAEHFVGHLPEQGELTVAGPGHAVLLAPFTFDDRGRR